MIGQFNGHMISPVPVYLYHQIEVPENKHLDQMFRLSSEYKDKDTVKSMHASVDRHPPPADVFIIFSVLK